MFAGRRPVTFYYDGRLGTMKNLLEASKGEWNPEYTKLTRDEYEREQEESYKDLLPWDDRIAIDDRTVDIFNWHFPLKLLAEAPHSPVLPDYLQRRLVLAVWARAILLNKDEIADNVAPEVIKLAREMSPVFIPYLKADSAKERRNAALYVLLKFPNLSPLVLGGVPTSDTAEERDYYFQNSWWCTPSNTEYDIHNERDVPKIVAKPQFLTAGQLGTARAERAKLIELGDGKSYLGKKAIEWANASPADARVPEALFIAAKANESYKYGCNGWESDKETKQQAETILRTRYPQSPWTAKLPQEELKKVP